MAAPSLWAGIDAGKLDHHCVLIDASGERLLSRRVRNDEAALTALIDDVIALADGGLVQWAIDLNAGGAALVISLLLARDQHLLYIPGRIVHHASAAYRGDGKTDAKDAAIIADQARMRRDLLAFRPYHFAWASKLPFLGYERPWNAGYGSVSSARGWLTVIGRSAFRDDSTAN